MPAPSHDHTTGHRQLEHTADLALEIWAPDEKTLLCEAARGVVEILTEGARVEPNASREIELETIDAADRLVRWLNEIVYLATVEGFVTVDASFAHLEEGLRATLIGRAQARDLLRNEIKSVTYHDLLFARGEQGIVARVIMDV